MISSIPRLSFARRRIGLLGGSFNPAHEGHLAMSLYALKRLNLDCIWWLVSPQNPLKPEEGMASLAQRIEKARELTARYRKIVATDIESKLGTHYTIDTLKTLKRCFPAARFVWLMGADNMMQIPRWHRWPQIFEQVPIAVFRRRGYSFCNEASVRFAHARQPAHYAKKLANAAPPAWLVLDNPLNLLSATAIRQQRSH